MAGGRFTPGTIGGVQSADFTQNTAVPGASSPAGQPSMMSPNLPGQGTGLPGYQVQSQAQGQPGAGWSLPGGAGAASPADDYRAAAALGMGVGPGQMFPVIRQAAVASAGTGSIWNGSQLPQTGRYLPSEQPIPDLSQAYELPSAANSQGVATTPPPSSMGMQMPTNGQYWTSPQQFSGATQGGSPGQSPPTDNSKWTRSMFEAQSATPGADYGLQTYNQVRSQHDAHLNASIQQTQGQYPSGQMLTPSYGIPVDRPADAPAQMSNWYRDAAGGDPAARNQQVVTPSPYYPTGPAGIQPAGGQASPQIAPLPNVNAAATPLPPAQYGSNVVVPPSYPGARAAAGQPIYPSGAPNGGGYQGPMIVPGN